MSERYVCGMGFTKEEQPIRIIHDNVEDKDYYLFTDICKIMNKQQEQIDLLEKNREILNKWLDEYVDKFTEVWRIVEPCRRG